MIANLFLPDVYPDTKGDEGGMGFVSAATSLLAQS